MFPQAHQSAFAYARKDRIMAKKTNKELFESIVYDCQYLTMSHRSQTARMKRLRKEIGVLCKNVDIEMSDEDITDLIGW